MMSFSRSLSGGRPNFSRVFIFVDERTLDIGY